MYCSVFLGGINLRLIAGGRGLDGVCDHINHFSHHIQEILLLKAYPRDNLSILWSVKISCSQNYAANEYFNPLHREFLMGGVSTQVCVNKALDYLKYFLKLTLCVGKF